MTIDDPCASALLTIDPTILTADPIIYDIGYPKDIQTFDASKVTSTVAGCPPLIFEVTDQADQPIDGSVFEFDPNSNELETDSDDLSKAGPYPLRLTVRYDGDYTNVGTLDFDVTLVNPCIRADLTIDPSILSNIIINYELEDAAIME